jgi:hypothetical protein
MEVYHICMHVRGNMYMHLSIIAHSAEPIYIYIYTYIYIYIYHLEMNKVVIRDKIHHIYSI